MGDFLRAGNVSAPALPCCVQAILHFGKKFDQSFTEPCFRILDGSGILLTVDEMSNKSKKEIIKMKKMSKILTTVLVIALAALTLVGCAKKDTSPVTTDGSTSMEKVIGTLGEAFKEKEGIDVTYNPTGSGSGIQAVSEGRCDIGLSSRALKDDEKATLTETTVALDGIAMIVNPENPVSDLTVEQIADIYTGKITNWSEVGGNDAAIVLIGREAGSGTRDGFESITDTKDACQYRQELTSTGDVITTVSQNPDAIGYASLAALKDTVKALTVGGVAPTEDTVKDGSYVIQRPFVLVTKTGETLSANAQKFFDFALSADAAPYITSAGAVPVNG